MPLKQRNKLFLKTHSSVMSLLVFDVLYDPIQLGNTYTEGSIIGLPREQTLVGETVKHLFRGAALDQLHGFGC